MDRIVGHRLYTEGGEDVGEIVDVLGLYGTDHSPAWLAVKTGWFARRLVPFRTVRERAEQYVTTCGVDTVKGAPKVPVHFEPSGDDLDALCAHYGLDREAA